MNYKTLLGRQLGRMFVMQHVDSSRLQKNTGKQTRK